MFAAHGGNRRQCYAQQLGSRLDRDDDFFERSYPVGACTASRRHSQTKLVKVFLRRCMAVSPGAAGNWRSAMLYGDLLEMSITPRFDSQSAGCGRIFSSPGYAQYEHFPPPE